MKNYKEYVRPEITVLVCEDVIMTSSFEPENDGGLAPDKDWNT